MKIHPHSVIKDVKFFLHWTFQHGTLEYCGHWSKFMRDKKCIIVHSRKEYLYGK